MSGQVVPLYPWVGPGEPDPANLYLSVELTEDGPLLHCEGRPATPEEMIAVGRALVDAGRAARNGDDPAEVIRLEWQRRSRPRPARPC